MKGTKRIVFLSILVSLGLALNIIESFIPIPFIAPGAKLGLSNMVILTTLVVIGFKEALIVGILKSIVYALVTGGFSGLLYSLSGSIFSCVIMYFVFKYLSNVFSLIGVSIFGAIAHNSAQILVASLMINNFKMFSYLPILLLTSLFTGYFVGLTSMFICNNLKRQLPKLYESN